MPDLRLSLFGPPKVEVGDRSIRLHRRKATAILAYLAVTAQGQRRETLAALFWPDSPHTRTLSNLRRDLCILSAALGEDRLEHDRELVALVTGSGFWCDVHQFESLQTERIPQPQIHETQISPIPRLLQAEALYHGDFLQGFSLPNNAEFEEWQFFQSERLRQAYLQVLKQLIGELLSVQNSSAIIPYALRWLAIEPLNEEILRLLIGLYIQIGQFSAALRQYERYTRILRLELGLDPSPETRALYKQLLSLHNQK